MELVLSGNMLMISPWLPELEKSLFFWRKDFSPMRKTRMIRENMYYTHEVDGVTVGYVPEGLLERVEAYLKKSGHSYTKKDLRTWATLPGYDFSRVDVTTLREGQPEALVEVASHYNGVIVAPTGFGKSFLIKQICKMYPTLNIVICTPRKPVVKSLYERLVADPALKDSMGVISSWKTLNPDNRVVVSTVRSLFKTDYEKCDLLLFDECHGVGAVHTAESLAKFTRARNFGFSATPTGRGDGADLVLESLFGPVRFDYTYQEAVDTGSVVPIQVYVVNVHGKEIHKEGRIALKRWGLWRNKERNAKIAESARAFGDDQQVLIMVETIEHGMHLKKELPEFTLVYSNCTENRYNDFVEKGFTNDKYLTDKEMFALQDDFESGVLKKVISTMKWREGIDPVHLNGLIRADGMSGSIPSTQIPGRLSRTNDDKTVGVLVDFMDNFDKRLKGTSINRVRNYNKLGWSVTYENKLNSFSGCASGVSDSLPF